MSAALRRGGYEDKRKVDGRTESAVMFLIMVVGTVVAPPQTGLLKRSLSSRQYFAADTDANATAEIKVKVLAIAEGEGNRDHASGVEAASKQRRSSAPWSPVE